MTTLPIRRTVVLAAFVLARSAALSAQTLPSEPIVLADGHVTIGGDLSATYGSDDTGFFNYTDYEHSALRMLRVDVSAALNAGDHVAVLGELRTENGERPRAYALYVRVRPWLKRPFDIEAGRIPPTFGAFARRVYAADNLLIGYPLAYQYLTSLRPDAIPATADELLKMRARGWLSNFSIGNVAPDRGLPLISAFSWDTGVQVHTATQLVEASVAVTTGTLSNPLFKDDNSGRQVAARVVLHPVAGLIVGGSVARGPFVTDSAARSAAGDGRSGDFTQTAWGADIEYSRDYYVVRAETIASRWVLPAVGTPLLNVPERALATYVEGRYKIRPGLYAAARADYLGFNDITGTDGRTTWDAPVTRIEIGGGYSIQRNLLLKASYQHNARSGGRVTAQNLGGAQLVFWF